MSELPPNEKNAEIESILKYHRLPEHEYAEDPEAPLESVSSIVNAIGIGWITLYGIKKQENGNYTIGFADENTHDCYKKEGFTESEMLEIYNTKQNGIVYKEMDERGQ